MIKGKPGRKCSICTHEKRGAIEHALASGRELATVAGEFKISPDALSRHKAKHLAAPIAEAEDLPVVAGEGAGDVLSDLANLRSEVSKLLHRAQKARNFPAQLGAVREAARLMELEGRLTGQIAADGTRVAIQVNTTGPGPVAIRERILEKLAALAGG